MEPNSALLTIEKTSHTWLRKVRVAYAPGPRTPMLEGFTADLLQTFAEMGYPVQDKPREDTEVVLTTARFGEPLNWRESLLLTARKRYRMERSPQVFTLLHITPGKLKEILATFERSLAKEPPDPQDFAFPGLTPLAYRTLYEQGRRGGPILSLVRLLQSQAVCIRLILVVGDDHPIEAYTIDLVGAHPRSDAADRSAFFEDLALRIATAASTHEITDHQVVGEPIPHQVWQSLRAPAAMRRAGSELGALRFFTEMVRVANLVNVPAVHDAVSSQYSEGCYATWEPALGALITTITGSARPVNKEKLTDDELAVLTGIRPDGLGALVRLVEGKRNDPPSSEAVEMLEMDSSLPMIHLGPEWEIAGEVPVARSKLHGHRGVRAFDPRRVEHVSLDPPYYHYPVSCSTEAQARAIRAAFARSAALNDPADPRQVVFSVLPGHGVVIAEKWVPGKEPLQVIWEFIDKGALEIDNLVPQGPLAFVLQRPDRMVVQYDE